MAILGSLRSRVPLGAAVALGLATAAACRDAEPHPSARPAPSAGAARAVSDAGPGPGPSWFRAEIGGVEEAVPFFLGLSPDAMPGGRTGQGACTIVNGAERLAYPCYTAEGVLTIEFPVFGNHIAARWSAAGALAGAFDRAALPGKPAPFRAEPIAAPDPARRFPADPEDQAGSSVTGSFRLDFSAFGLAKADLLEAADGSVTGDINMTRIGDMRYLAGNRHGQKLKLSTFDGMHAYLVIADLGDDGTPLRGEWHFPGVWHDAFTGSREDVDPAVLNQIGLAPGKQTVTIPQLAEAGLTGRPLVVEYFWTWCPACIDQTPFLADVRRRYGPRGLEVVSIAVEAYGDPTADRAAVERFKRVYSVTWPTFLVSVPDTDDMLAALPPELVNTGGFPVTLFLRADGTVRAVHSGFLSPAAGADHTAMVKTYLGYIEDIIGPAAAPAGNP